MSVNEIIRRTTTGEFWPHQKSRILRGDNVRVDGNRGKRRPRRRWEQDIGDWLEAGKYVSHRYDELKKTQKPIRHYTN